MSALDRLLALPRFADAGAAAYAPGLERIRALLAAMGDPHVRYPTVHVAGTNGKGSTASMVAAVATAMGHRTGLHTSPHLYHPGERMRIDGEPAAEAWLESAAERWEPLFERVGPSFFEATVALSLLYFAEREVDWAVVEVGLGGRLDATNVLRPRAALVTSIGLDHQDLLGATRAAIAREKGGIAKPGVPLLTSSEGDDVRAALAETAAAAGAPYEVVWDSCRTDGVVQQADAVVLDLETPVRRYPALRVGLPGRHQVGNALLAVRAAEAVLAAPEPAVRGGLAEVRKLSGLAGRCERWHSAPTVLADVAHNPDGLAAALACARAALGGGGRLYVAFGAMADKDAGALADALAAAGSTVLPLALPGPRALPLDRLRALLFARQIPILSSPSDPAEAVRYFRSGAAPPDVLLVTGSHLAVAGAHAARAQGSEAV